jgi:hypothetical protein
LAFREVDVNTQPAQKPNRCDADIGKEAVAQASDHEGNVHARF